MDMVAHACAACVSLIIVCSANSGQVPSLKSVIHAPAMASTPDRDPPRLARGQVVVPVRPQQGSVSPGMRVSHKSVSAVTLTTVATVS